VSHYGDTGLPEPVNGLRRHLRDGVDGRISGNRGSQQYPSRGRYIESVRATGVMANHRARRCSSNHWRPDTHGEKTGAGKRRPRPPATLSKSRR
jgi:hypothetical protein